LPLTFREIKGNAGASPRKSGLDFNKTAAESGELQRKQFLEDQSKHPKD
jgi:hypothetical protein